MSTPPTKPVFKIADYPDSGLGSSDALDKFFSQVSNFTDSVVSCLNGGLTLDDNSKVEVKVLNVTTPASAWVTPTLQNGWTPLIRIQYRVCNDGFVQVRGYAGSGAAGTSIFTLPSALWPTDDANFATDSNGAYGKVVATGPLNATPGVVKSTVGTPLALDVVRFEPAVVAPYVHSCFPLNVSSKLAKITYFNLLKIYDATSQTQLPCAPGGVHAIVAKDGYQILNIPGLLFGKKYQLTVAVSGS